MLVFLPPSHALLEKVHADIYAKAIKGREDLVSLLYTRNITATEIQAKQIFAMDEFAGKTELLETAKEKEVIVWIVGAKNQELMLPIINDVNNYYKGYKNALYSTVDKKAVENVVRLLTVDWKEKGNAFNK